MCKPVKFSTFKSNKDAPNYLEINDLKKHIKLVTNKNIRYQQKITRQKQELIEMAEINTRFLLIIGHDLRNPLSAVMAVLKLLRDSNPSDTKEYIDIASNSAARAIHLSNSLVAWATSQYEGDRLQMTEINLHDLLTDEVANSFVSAKQKQISLVYEGTSPGCVVADEEMIKTVLRNLISNAIKYTPLGGRVTVLASRTKRMVKISVKDTGVGVTPEMRKKLMRKDSFFSTPGTMNEKGTGLGLLICKDFVELHGGKLSGSSKAKRGSTFHFTLPLSLK
ncbi:HAMP domain-containing histidine kinase [Fulvivirga ulvae]|uniref:sensor histidine kinase n=1 Tax=Fulvivirga ulvae TaxID=2904245 RepID=UPI001F1D8069|nr:HAMP domain-containing sensor histidine kinase [Fulvivirga ulvae]UII32803.1 HAMP domain-containing histidine kinase [Fulvivirga ulvae]